jgi:hypothetical protein
MVRRRYLRVIPIATVLLIAAVGLLMVVTGHWRRGAGVVAISAGVAAVLRLFVADGAIGPLAVRSRTFDVLFLGALTLILVLGTTVGF